MLLAAFTPDCDLPPSYASWLSLPGLSSLAYVPPPLLPSHRRLLQSFVLFLSSSVVARMNPPMIGPRLSRSSVCPFLPHGPSMSLPCVIPCPLQLHIRVFCPILCRCSTEASVLAEYLHDFIRKPLLLFCHFSQFSRPACCRWSLFLASSSTSAGPDRLFPRLLDL